MVTKLLVKMLAKRGKTVQDLSPSSNIAKRRKATGIQETDELIRVRNLSQRDWEKEDIHLLQEEMTDWLRTLGGGQTLRAAQVMSLTDLHDMNGLLGIILVGGGKTLITRLAPLVVEATRPVLLVPAHLKEKTIAEFCDLDAHWQKHDDYDIVSYQKLGRVSGSAYLDDRQPDLIVADEAQYLKNRDAAVTKRVERYMEEHQNTIFCALSGTITSRSIMDFHHLLRWSLGHIDMPMPSKASEATEWAEAIDEKCDNQRRSPGALLTLTSSLVPENNYTGLTAARYAFNSRLVASRGVITTKESKVAASIVGSFWEPEIPDTIVSHIDKLKEDWETPGGELCRQAIDVWRHVRELVCGFYYRWDPEPPEDWLRKRRAWFYYVRQVLEERTPGLDSPLQVWTACNRGLLHSGNLCEEWEEIKDTFKANTVPVWLDTSVMQQVIDRVGKHNGIIWVDHVATGEKLARMSGIPFFSRKGLDTKTKMPIEEYAGKGPAIASIASNGTGRNLQAWNRNFIVSPPSNGKIFEQLFGRQHRFGQKADEVFYEIMLGDSTLREGMRQALRDAKYIQETQGTEQKLLLAGLQVVDP